MSRRFFRPPDSFAIAALLTVAVGLGPLATDLYLPSLPSIGAYFQASVADTQLTLSVFLIGFAASQLIYGPLSDRFGRRPVMLAGFTIFAAASVLCALAPSMELLIIGRFLQALGVCGGPVLGRAVVRDVYGPDRAARVLSYMATAMALGPALGLLLGGVLETQFGWRAAFWALFGVGLFLLAAVGLTLPETNRHRDPSATRPDRILRNFGTLLTHQSYIGFALIVAFSYAGIFAFISGSPFVLMRAMGLSPTAYSLYSAAVISAYMVGAFISGRFALRLGQERLIAMGVALGILSAGSGLVFAWLGIMTLPTVLLPLAGYLLAAGLMLSNAIAGALRHYPHMAGSASSLIGFIQMGSAALLGVGIGHLDDGTSLPMAAANALSGLIVLLAYVGLVLPGLAKDRRRRALSDRAAYATPEKS